MAILESRTRTGISWVKESLALFRQSPRRWMLLALVYVSVFIMLPSMQGLQFFAMVTILIWPAFIVLAVVMYKNAECNQVGSLSETLQRIRPKLTQLMLLGMVCLFYGVLMSYLLENDIQGLLNMAQAKVKMTEAQTKLVMDKMVPFMLKMGLFLVPLLMATWFSPMLIALNGYSPVKAIKSSVAGCLQYAIALLAAWLLLITGIVTTMLAIAIILGIISALVPAFAQFIAPLIVFMSLLVATALMLAFQYVSYRDVFRAAPQL